MGTPETSSVATRLIRVLHLEDNPRDAELIHHGLEVAGVGCDIVLVNSRDSFEAALVRESFDLIITDYNLQGYDGISALKRAQEQQPDAPVILISGSLGEDEAVKCLHTGATDYLLKGHLERLAPAVRRAIDEAEVLRGRRQAGQALLQSERDFRALFAANPLPMWIYSLKTLHFLEVNDAAVQNYGYTRDEFLAMTVEDIRPLDDADRLLTNMAQPRLTSEWAGSCRHRVESGRLIDVEVTSHEMAFAGQSAALVVAQDITERRTLEEQFQQAQKMEAVGRLAGGVAHDFNNLLTVILGLCDLLLADRNPDDPRQADIAEIQEAGTRAAGLTRQLLAFSRKQIIEPTLLDMNVIVADMRAMLGRLIGEDVKVVLGLGADLALVKADRGQVEQIVMNLAVNARDAMPTGGTLTIETANVELDGRYAKTHLDVKPGLYVGLTVTDTGTGMTPQVQARLFEPFFTTKEPGKGTGLGMATVFGIVTRSGGSVGVYSEVGKGTQFKVYFPRADAAEAAEIVGDTPAPVARPRAGTQTVLVVEDEDGLRELAKRLLQRLGYTVLIAGDASEASRLFEENPTIDVLLTDVVMPGASGPELTSQLIERRPELKVIYMSGYTEDAIVNHGVLKAGIAFLHKPFTSETLGRKIRDVLDTPPTH
jgi:two-component system, cell cycle sensor histidine kinase and response regulator CckA